MRRAHAGMVRMALPLAAMALAAPVCAGTGVRLGGSIGTAPEFARTVFDSQKDQFKYSARGIQVGFVTGKTEVDFFMDTINKGFINRGYKASTCFVISSATKCFPDGTYLDPVGVRLIGMTAGGFHTVHDFNKWMRLGVPFHVGFAIFTGQATKVTYTNKLVDSDPTRAGFEGIVATQDVTKVAGKKIMNGGYSPYPMFDLGLAMRVKTSSWAEIEIGVRAQNFRAPALAWCMILRKNQ